MWLQNTVDPLKHGHTLQQLCGPLEALPYTRPNLLGTNRCTSLRLEGSIRGSGAHTGSPPLRRKDHRLPRGQTLHAWRESQLLFKLGLPTEPPYHLFKLPLLQERSTDFDSRLLAEDAGLLRVSVSLIIPNVGG